VKIGPLSGGARYNIPRFDSKMVGHVQAAKLGQFPWHPCLSILLLAKMLSVPTAAWTVLVGDATVASAVKDAIDPKVQSNMTFVLINQSAPPPTLPPIDVVLATGSKNLVTLLDHPQLSNARLYQ
jgi:hypothetical protein